MANTGQRYHVTLGESRAQVDDHEAGEADEIEVERRVSAGMRP